MSYIAISGGLEFTPELGPSLVYPIRGEFSQAADDAKGSVNNASLSDTCIVYKLVPAAIYNKRTMVEVILCPIQP